MKYYFIRYMHYDAPATYENTERTTVSCIHPFQWIKDWNEHHKCNYQGYTDWGSPTVRLLDYKEITEEEYEMWDENNNKAQIEHRSDFVVTILPQGF